MTKKTIEINSLLDILSGLSVRSIFDDDLWKIYGFRRRPRTFIINFFPSKKLYIRLIKRDIISMGIIDIINGIKKSNIDKNTKVIIAMGVLNRAPKIYCDKG